MEREETPTRGFVPENTIDGRRTRIGYRTIPVTGRYQLKDDIVDELVTGYDGADRFSVIDIGCGGAGYHPGLKRDLEENLPGDVSVEVIGVDANREVLYQVQEGDYSYPCLGVDERFFGETPEGDIYMTDEPRNELTLVVSDGFRLPFKDESVDAVVSQYMGSHYSRNGQDLLSEAERIVKPSGRVWFYETGRLQHFSSPK